MTLILTTSTLLGLQNDININLNDRNNNTALLLTSFEVAQNIVSLCYNNK